MPEILCAWCGAKLGDDPALTDTSHGICTECQRKHFPVRPSTPSPSSEV